ncbi:MAG: outer membrane protein transport protein, partial [Gammaproteobacteria bacterium]|nr:outer membrane protein transport protein [Gammaproteobacteria bacterium]
MTYKRIAKVLLGLGFVSSVAATGSAYASAFQLSDQSAAQLGTAYAGGAAIADDASTEWYNPAGMVRINAPELSMGMTDIYTHIKFNGTVSGSAVNTGA